MLKKMIFGLAVCAAAMGANAQGSAGCATAEPSLTVGARECAEPAAAQGQAAEAAPAAAQKAVAKKRHKRRHAPRSQKVVEVFGGEMGPVAAAAGNPRDLRVAGPQAYESFDSVMMPQSQAIARKKAMAKETAKAAGDK